MHTTRKRKNKKETGNAYNRKKENKTGKHRKKKTKPRPHTPTKVGGFIKSKHTCTNRYQGELLFPPLAYSHISPVRQSGPGGRPRKGFQHEREILFSIFFHSTDLKEMSALHRSERVGGVCCHGVGHKA